MPELTADLPRKPCFRGFSSPPGAAPAGEDAAHSRGLLSAASSPRSRAATYVAAPSA